MGKHVAENPDQSKGTTYTSKSTPKYAAKHRAGVAPGTDAQRNQTTPSDIPHYDGCPGDTPHNH